MQDMWVSQWLNACSQENAWQQTTTDAKAMAYSEWLWTESGFVSDFGDQKLNLLLYLKTLANE